VLSVLLRFTDSDYPVGIFKLFYITDVRLEVLFRLKYCDYLCEIKLTGNEHTCMPKTKLKVVIKNIEVK